MLLIERRSTASSSLIALFTAVFLVHGAIALFIGDHGWDDGSITVSFARTFAESGRIALTPHSDVVEGFSSPFWLLLLAGTYHLLPLGFGGMILASQLWSAFFAAIGSTLLYALLRPFLSRAAFPLSFIVFISSVFLNETANGMEMSALSALTLATVWAIKERHPMPVLFSLALLTPLVRFEAAGYVIAGCVLLASLSRDSRTAGTLLCGVLISLMVLTGLRLAIFDSPLPNTMIAKQSPPYPYGTSLDERISMAKTVVKEIFYVFAPGAIIAVGGLVGQRCPRSVATTALARLRSRSLPPVIAYSLGFIAGAVAANLVIGPNWGYLGRMEQSLVALTVVTVVYSMPRAMRSLQSPLRLSVVLAALVIVAVYGVDRERIDTRIHHDYADAITPAAYRETAEAIEVVREHLGTSTLSVLTPDVGGSSLCCPQFEVLDLGLLANRELAHDGYGAIGSYLEMHKPDVVVTHTVWSDASQLYGVAYFRENYSPIAVHGMWFYLRNDLLDRLAEHCHPISLEAAGSFRYRGDEIDERYIRTIGAVKICQLTEAKSRQG